jgi:hypothetical protein
MCWIFVVLFQMFTSFFLSPGGFGFLIMRKGHSHILKIDANPFRQEFDF